MLALSGCREYILNNLSEADANRSLARLHEFGSDAQKVRQPDGRWAIEVPDEQSGEAIHQLTRARLIREEAPQPLQSSSMIAGRDELRFRYERSLSREIEATLGSMSGVLEARVHLNLPLVDALFGRALEKAPGSGSVVLMVEEEFTFNTAQVQDLVAGASGVEAKSIAVLIETQSRLAPAAQVARVRQAAVDMQDRSADAAANTLLQTPFSAGQGLPVLFALLLIAAGSFLLWWSRRDQVRPSLKEGKFRIPAGAAS